MDIEAYLKPDSQAAAKNEPDWTAALGDNVLKPLYNGSIVQTANTVSNLGNTFGVGMGRLQPYKLDDANLSTSEELLRGFSGAVGAILPYAVAGKLAGGAMRGTGRALALEGASARLFASEASAQVLGAAAFDSFRDVNEKETRAGNVLGGMAAFSVFGRGNNYIRSQGFNMAERVIGRAAIGAFGAEMQLGISRTVSGESISAQDFSKAALHGAFFNVGLPVVHEKLGKVVDSVNVKLGRGVPLERFATEHDLHWQSELLNGLMRSNPLVRVKPYADAPAQVDHIQKTVTVNLEGNVAGQLGHELSHFGIAKRAEPHFVDAAKLLANGDYHGARSKFLETRRAQEIEATATGREIQGQSEAALARRDGKEAPKLGEKQPEATTKLSGAYDEIFKHEWDSFVESKGAFRPKVENSVPSVPPHHDVVSFEQNGTPQIRLGSAHPYKLTLPQFERAVIGPPVFEPIAPKTGTAEPTSGQPVVEPIAPKAPTTSGIEISAAARQEAGLGDAPISSLAGDVRVRYARVLDLIDATQLKPGLDALVDRTKVAAGTAKINEKTLATAEKILALSPEEIDASGVKWCLGQGKVNRSLTKDTLDAYLAKKRLENLKGIVEVDQPPPIDFDATRLAMRRAQEASGAPTIDLPALIESQVFAKVGKGKSDLIAEAIANSSIYGRIKQHLTEAEVLGEGGEAVVIRLKGPFVLDRGDGTIVLPEMAMKVMQPTRGEWHENWGDWTERPWDALTVSHETVSASGRTYEVLMQELLDPGVSQQHQRRFENMIRDWNNARATSRDDSYQVWDADSRGNVTHQLAYSALPVRPSLADGCVWVSLNGQRMRVVLTDPWTVCRYGEDGRKE